MDRVLEEATSKGMYVVDHENLDNVKKEFDEGLKESDNLCKIVDPDEEPFRSKYKALTMLDNICNKMEATRTIASLEKKKSSIDEMNWRIAYLRIRIGSISFDCEDFSSCQKELELAAEHFSPGLVSTINELTPDEPTAQGEKNSSDVSQLQPPPTYILKIGIQIVATMKCLNLLGILWGNRQNTNRSFLYLLAAKEFYDCHATVEQSHPFLSTEEKQEMESCLTHNLFYLAQAYGLIGNAELSSRYCHQTLQRQLLDGIGGKAALEWCKNCMALSDYYLSLQKFRQCARALASVNTILGSVSSGSGSGSGSHTSEESLAEVMESLQEIKADNRRRVAKLDLAVLLAASERKLSGMLMAPEESAALSGGTEATGGAAEEDLPPATVFRFMRATPSQPNPVEQKETDSDIPSSRSTAVSAVGFFGELLTSPTKIDLPDPTAITTFEACREVFLRFAANIEAAKKHYLLDGFVTDHTKLLQDQSKAYHCLAAFEPDAKRRVAMELRRGELLAPLLDSLSRTAYDHFHKEISYELGEVFLGLVELKGEMLRSGSSRSKKSLTKDDSEAFNPTQCKPKDIEKLNEYCMRGLDAFAHFTGMYEKSASATRKSGGSNAVHLTLPQLMRGEGYCIDPDLALLNAEEVRPFLNAHFLSCRLLAKILPTATTAAAERALGVVTALSRYQWIQAKASSLCEQKGLKLSDIFADEISICKDMIHLLPSKIDRIHYTGDFSL